MAQTKKKEMREAILAAAYPIFRDKGYLKCRMKEIAAAAGTSVSNLYVYFPSKLHLMYEVYAPMITSRMMKLANDKHAITDPKQRLRYIFLTLWRDIPTEDNNFARNLMQAIVTASPDHEKPHDPLRWLESFTNDMIRECLPENRWYMVEDSQIAFLTWMAFDGFVLNVGKGEDRDIDAMVTHFVDMLFGDSNTVTE